jgi:F-type H+-transporting ATPase subunit a
MRPFGRILTSLLRTPIAHGTAVAMALMAAPLASGGRLLAQQPAPAAAEKPVDYITPHITDSYEMEVPAFNSHFGTEWCISGKHGAKGECLPLWGPVHIGGLEVNLSPTKHVVFMLLSAILAIVILVGSAVAQRRHQKQAGHTKGFAGGIEAMVLYLRNEVVLPNVGPHGQKYVPFGLTLFFFILLMNLFGLIPYGATATGNIAVTATLAIITLVVVEVSGMITQRAGYLGTIFYWNKDLPLFMRPIMFIVMTPVELISKLSKPFALAIRLFANMTAGHIVVLALIGLIFAFKSVASGAPFLMAVAIMALELFVAVLQAYIFTLLSSVFIGLLREGGH